MEDAREGPLRWSNLVQLLAWRARHQGDRRAYTFLLDGETAETTLTYAELDCQARAVAVMLGRVGQVGERVVLLFPPGLEYIVGFFGCLYAGMIAVPAYLPRPNRPDLRLAALIGDSQARLILSIAPVVSEVQGWSAEIPEMKALRWLITDNMSSGQADEWQSPDISDSTLALLQYTSGSTTSPRGVKVDHGNLLHNSAYICRSFEHSDRSLGVIWLPPYHDMGLIGGVLQPLYVGFPVVLMAPVHFLQQPIRWLRAISRYRGTTSGGPNFSYDWCVRRIPPDRREGLDLRCWDLAFNGAEPIRAETMQRFAEAFAPCGFRYDAFYPCYGLAEATLMVAGGQKSETPCVRLFSVAALSHNHVAPSTDLGGGVLLTSSGQALPGEQIVVVDPETSVSCASDRVGEIWVSGPGVAQGYWNQPAETERTFGARLADTGKGPFLRTGDLGFLYEGDLFITGRLKDLIIIRGRNYYPQDIERTAECSHVALQEESGVAFSVDEAGDEQLVVVQEVKREYLNANLDEIARAIQRAVAEEHELRIHAVVLCKPGRIPKTTSGKVQRYLCRARFLDRSLDMLSCTRWENLESEQKAIPTSGRFVARALAAIQDINARRALLVLFLQDEVARILHVPSSGISTKQAVISFGLDSLASVQLAHSVETNLNVLLPVAVLLSGPSLEQLADYILAQPPPVADALQRGTAAELAVQPRDPTRVSATLAEAPLSHGQQALWFLCQLAPESTAYSIPIAVRIRSSLNIAALHRALEKLIARHSALRTTFTISPASGQPMQHMSDQLRLDWEVADASAWNEESLNEQLNAVARSPFNLETGPLLRVRVYRCSAEEYIVLLVIHHIITDFWSLTILVQELALLYPAECAGRSAELPPLQYQYSDFVRWQSERLAGARGEVLRAYWLAQLAGDLPLLDLPFDHLRHPAQTNTGGVHVVRLDSRLSERLKMLCKELRATLNTLLLAVFETLLYRYTGQDDFLVGTLAAGRDQSEWAAVMGYFVNPIIIRARPRSDQMFLSFVDETRQAFLAALEHQDYPFTVLVNELRPARDDAASPLLQAMFIFQKAHHLHVEGLTAFALDTAGVRLELAGLRLESMALAHPASQFDLTLTMGEAEDGLVGSFEYNADLYDAGTIARLGSHLINLLTGIVENPDRRLCDLPLLSEAEQQLLLTKWNGSSAEPLPAAGLAALFEAQTKCTPAAEAVFFDDQSLSYAELDHRATQLAAYLQEMGVGPEACVGVYMPRSPETIVSVLAILKAGGAFVLLDPADPPERLAFVVSDARVAVLLTGSLLATPALLADGRISVPVVSLDVDRWKVASAINVGRLQNNNRHADRNLACVIYTSGSTGQPKGVMLEQRALMNLVNSFAYSYHPTARDRILPLTSITSASFVGEILPLLCVGGALVLARDEELLDLGRLADIIARREVSIVSAVPTLIAALNSRRCDLSSLRLLLSGGEALDIDDIDHLLNTVSIVNSYGLTETGICSTFYEVDKTWPSEEPHIPIGRPIINTAVYVLDANLNCLPIGCRGEVYIAGEGLARGYQGNPTLTAERFIPNPYRPGQRMYRTGDVARWLAGGVLEYLNRADRQVKIRGFRIEPGEVEAALKRHPDVRDAVVVARTDASADRRLIAYIVPAERALTGSELHNWLASRLPRYMMPSAFELIDALPIARNGKVDLQALPAPQFMRPDLITVFRPPQSAVERSIAQVWQAALGLDKVGVNDNFFELGGNSMLAAQVHRQLREVLKIDLNLVELFHYPTISALAKHLGEEGPKTTWADDLHEEAARRREALGRRRQVVKGMPG